MSVGIGPTVVQLPGGGVTPAAVVDAIESDPAAALAALDLALVVASDASDLIVLPMTETSGTYANTGTAGGAFTLGADARRLAPGDRFGGGVDLQNTADSHVRGGASVEPATGQLTLWAWVRQFATQGADDNCILGKSKGADPTWADPWWLCGLHLVAGSGRLRGYVSSGAPGSLVSFQSTSARDAVRLGEDALVGLTHDGATAKLWLNGREVGSVAAAFAIGWDASATWTMGGVWSGAGDRFNGAVLRAGVCNTARASAWWVEAYRRGLGVWR